ncbi:hypothetical protein Tco_0501761 [Tanacetum coccineum]
MMMVKSFSQALIPLVSPLLNRSLQPIKDDSQNYGEEKCKEEDEMGTAKEVEELFEDEESEKETEEVEEVFDDETEEEEDDDTNYYNSPPAIKELVYHEWLLENP